MQRARDKIYSSLEDISEHFRSYTDRKTFAQGLKSKNTPRYQSLLKILRENELEEWCSSRGYSCRYVSEVEIKRMTLELASTTQHPFPKEVLLKYKSWK